MAGPPPVESYYATTLAAPGAATGAGVPEYPALRGEVTADVAFEYVWGGEIVLTRERTPHLGRLGNNVYFAQGYAGQGVALSGLAGKLLAEVVAGEAGRFELFARLPHRRFPGGRLLAGPAPRLALLWYRLRDLL